MKCNKAFSNGDEFAIWEGSWCAKCEKDAAFRARGFEGNDGCKILAVGLMGGDFEIAEWETDEDAKSRGVWPRVRCTEFVEIERRQGTP